MKAILIDFDGTESRGIYKVYPATEDSEPDFVFQGEFYYGDSDDEDLCTYTTKEGARRAAYNTALHVAKKVGATILSNELERA
jgi:hypothetical protein